MISPFLESTLLGACPGLRESWESHRRTFGRGEEADDGALLDAVRRYVIGLLAAGRVAEFSRFARTLERLLGEADPMLYDLLREGLLRPLAHEVRDVGIEHSRVARTARAERYFPCFALYASSCCWYWLSTRMIAMASTSRGVSAASAHAASSTGVTCSRIAAGARWLRATWSSTA